LGVIRHNAATLLKHVNDLLDLAKLDAGKMTMDYVNIDLARMVRTVASHFDALAPQKSISYAVLAPMSHGRKSTRKKWSAFCSTCSPMHLSSLLMGAGSNVRSRQMTAASF